MLYILGRTCLFFRLSLDRITCLIFILQIRNRLDSTDSIYLLLDQSYTSIPEKYHDSQLYKELGARLAKCRKVGRRMRMKYEPLLNLLDGLGGDASALKSAAEKLRKGLHCVCLAVGTSTTMYVSL